MGQVIDMTEWDGDTGAWAVLAPDPDRIGWWLCRCECGTESSIRGAKIRDGTSARCGECRKKPKTDAIRRRAGFGRPAVRDLCDTAQRERWTVERLITELRRLTD